MFHMKVSVCMIAYNVEKYIGKAIIGVLSQEADFEIELIISNDNSTDRTEQIINSFIYTHPRGSWIKYVKHSKNIGMLPNYLSAFKLCDGKYLSICDSDDYWTDEFKLQKQIDFLESNLEFVLSFHDSFIINEEDKVIQDTLDPYIKKDLSFKNLTEKVYPLPTASIVFRNDLSYTFPKEYIEGSNHDTFLFVILSQFGKFHYNPKVLPSAYRIHSNGTWSSRSKMGRSLHSLLTFSDISKVFPHESGFKKRVFEFRNHVFIYAIKEKEYSIFLQCYLKNLILSFSKVSYFKLFWQTHIHGIKKYFRFQ